MPTRAPRTPPFEIRSSPIAGRGAFATRAITRGERVIEYVGERISHAVADARYDDAAMSEHHTFLFAVSNRTVIDAAHGGNDARFINHSCAPNCEAVIDKSRVFVDAIRDIAVGEELFYDYEYQRSGDETAEDEARYRCACGAATCRGSIMESRAAHEARVAAEAAKRAAKRAAKQSTIADVTPASF